MGTANFWPMQYNMPLVCGNLKDFEDCKTEYEADTGEEYTEFIYEIDLEDWYRYAEERAEAFTETLKFHDVTVKSGYYQGFQFYVEERYSNLFDLDQESKYCIDNDDAHYYFGLCRSKALRAADAEKRKIRKFLLDLGSMENYGYNIMVCSARFSNGEAWYSKVS